MTDELKREDIVPEIQNDDVIYLASLYNIPKKDIKSVSNLISYDDKVFHIKTFNPLISYVLKCSIAMTFKNIDLQTQFINILHKHNIPSPQLIPLKSKYQTNNHKYIYITKEYPYINDINSPIYNKNIIKTPKIKHTYPVNIHCMTFINGKMPIDLQLNNKFYYHLGNTIGNLTNSLNGFQHKSSKYITEWEISCIGSQLKPKIKLNILNSLFLNSFYKKI